MAGLEAVGGWRDTSRPTRLEGSQPQLRRHDLIDRLGVRLAAGGLHHLAYEPAREFGVLFGLFDLGGVGGDDLSYKTFNIS